MKKQIGIWMDTKEAIIITLEGTDSPKVNQVKNKAETLDKKTSSIGVISPTFANTKLENNANNHIQHFQKEIFEKIKPADEWYLCGPAEAKTEFKDFLSKNHADELHKLKAVDNAENLSTKEMTEKVMAFFKLT